MNSHQRTSEQLGFPEEGARALSLKAFSSMFGVIFLIALAPILAAPFPPLHDYPFHIARADILVRLPTSPFVSAHYALNNLLIPNIGMDAAMLVLTEFMPVEVAGRALLGLILGLLLSGVATLHYVLHRRLSVWPLFACVFLYNWILLYGFLNYLLGVGLAFWCVAAWIGLRDAPAISRTLTATLSAVILSFCHLEAFGVFAAMAAGIELQAAAETWKHDRPSAILRVATASAPFVFVMAVFSLLSPTAAEARRGFDYNPWWGWKPLVAYRTLLTSIRWLDIVTSIALIAGLGAAIQQGLRLAAPMRTAMVFLVAAFLALPSGLFGALYADARLPIAVVFAAIACTDLTRVTFRQRQYGLFIGVALSFAAHTAIVAVGWNQSSRTIGKFVAAFAALPEGSTLFAATAAPYPSLGYRTPAELNYWHPPLKHVVSLASLNRSVFVPATWANPHQQPIRVASTFESAKAFQGDNPLQIHSDSDLIEVIEKVRALRGSTPRDRRPEFLLVIYPELLAGSVPKQLKLLSSGEHFVLIQID